MIMEIIGKTYEVDFGMAKAMLKFQSKNSLLFTITKMNGKAINEIETVAIKLIELRPKLYLITWKEKNGNTVTQVQDYENGIIYSNWTLPTGEFNNIKGTLKPI
jgi:hypothetical protein